MNGRLECSRDALGRWVDSIFLGPWRWVLLLALLGLAWPLVAERGLIVESDYPGWASIVNMLDREVLPQVLGTVVGSPVDVGQGTSDQYNPFTLLGLYLSRSILLVSLYGLAGAVWRRRPVLRTILPPLLLAFALCRNWTAAVPFPFPLKSGLIGFASRFMLMASAATLVLFALGVARVQAALWTGRRAAQPLARWILGLLVLGVVLLGLKQTFIYQPRTLGGENALTDHRDFMAVCDWVDKNADREVERVYVEDTFASWRDFSLYPANRAGRFLLRTLGKSATPFTHYISLLSLRTGCQQVNGFALYQNPFNEQYCSNSRRLLNLVPEKLTARKLREGLWALNCRHILSFSDRMREFLTTIRFLRCSCRFGRFCAFTWSDMPSHYAWSGGPNPQPVPVTRLSAIRYVVALPQVRPTTVHLSLQHHANWKAYLEGTPVRVIPWRGLMRLQLPAGAGGESATRL